MRALWLIDGSYIYKAVKSFQKIILLMLKRELIIKN